MRAAWMVVSTLALANLLAIAGFIGWLGGTQRLSRERVQAVRVLFAQTVAQEKQALDQSQQAARDAAARQGEAERMAVPPVTAADKIQQQRTEKELKLQLLQRRESEIKGLQVWLERENERLQKWQTDLQAREDAFAAQRKRIAETDGSEQFKKALATLNGLKPKEAQTMLGEMLSQGKIEEVVSYLNAMEERTRSKVLAEFSRGEPKVAADLLERLRTRGLLAAAPEAKGK